MSVVSTTVTTTTASPNGYKLYLGMSGSTNDLVNTSNSSLRIASTKGTLTSPVALSAEGTWGFALSSTASKVVASGFDTTYTTGSSFTPNNNKFASIPTSDKAPQLIAESDTASAAGGDNLSVYYGVSANYGIPSGTYSNTVKYTAIADSGSGHNLYVYPNKTTTTVGGDPIAVATTLYATTSTGLTSDIPANVYMLTASELTNVHNGTPVSLYNSKRLTCSRVTTSETLAFDCTTLPADNGSYYIYVDIPTYGESYEAPFLVTAPTSFFTLTTMQQMSDHPEFCTSATTPSNTAQYEDTTGAFAGNTNYVPTVTLRDTRDEETYRIRKLADGNCWMTENLRLGSSTATMTLTSNDSDVTSDFVLPIAQTSDGVEWTADTKRVYATGNAAYGNYYNWFTATAGTGVSTMVSTSATDLLNATSSVCPKGWRLPDGGQSTKMSFYQLDKAYGGNGANRLPDVAQRDKFMADPLNFLYSGLYENSAGLYQGSRGAWFARSAFTTAGSSYGFYFKSDGAYYPQPYFLTSVGANVRCLADTRTLFDIDKMQEMTPQIVKNTTTPLASATQADTDGSHKGDNTYVPQHTLTDIRDGETYRVRKLADGNIWMTENLRKELTQGEILIPATTNVTADTTVGATTQPSTQSSTDYYGWGVGDKPSDYTGSWPKKEDTERWLSRGTSGTTGNKTESQITGGGYPGNLTGENQKIGIHYTWYAATAGTGTYTIDTSIDAPTDICPRGFQLPRRDSANGSFTYLLRNAYSIISAQGEAIDNASVILHGFPFSMPYSGDVHWNLGSSIAQGDYSLFWSAGANHYVNASILYFSGLKNVYPALSVEKLYGAAIRCIAK